MKRIPVAALGRFCIIATGLTIKCIVCINIINFSLLILPNLTLTLNTHVHQRHNLSKGRPSLVGASFSI